MNISLRIIEDLLTEAERHNVPAQSGEEEKLHKCSNDEYAVCEDNAEVDKAPYHRWSVLDWLIK